MMDDTGDIDSFLSLGRFANQDALRLYCQCLATGVWPGYDDMRDNIHGWTLASTEVWMD